jgi:hypothetical protein
LVWATVFRGALEEQRTELHFQRAIRLLGDIPVDLEAAIGNVYRAVRTFGDDPRLLGYWAQILDGLIPAHRLVIKRATRHDAGLDELVARGTFTASEAQQIRDSIEGLRDLERRLVDYQKEIAAQLQAIPRQRRKTT